jgi:hypothetical protein
MSARAKAFTALQLFRSGNDTLVIARVLQITEAEALEQLSKERSAVLHRGDPYMSHRFPGGDPNYQSSSMGGG